MVLNAHRRRDRKRCTKLQVYLDGKLVPRAYYADGRRGVVRAYAEDVNGKPVFRRWQLPDGTWEGELIKVEMRGKVKWVPYVPKETR